MHLAQQKKHVLLSDFEHVYVKFFKWSFISLCGKIAKTYQQQDRDLTNSQRGGEWQSILPVENQ